MAIQIKQYLDDIYKKVGNVTRDQLPLEIVLTYLYDELNKRSKMMDISEQNYFLKYADRALTHEQDQPVSIEDFGTPVAVWFINPFTDIEIPVEMVNFSALSGIGAHDGRLVCTIYGSPKRIRFAVKLNHYSGWRIKYWYEPVNEVEKGPEANSIVPDKFRALVTSAVARMVLPFAEIPADMKQMIDSNLATEIIQWEQLWDQDINSSKQYGNNKRTAFRAGQFDRRHIRW